MGDNSENAGWATEFRGMVEKELQKICDDILELLGGTLIEKAESEESKVFYQKMKADYHRYIAEFAQDAKRTDAAEAARGAYEDAKTVAHHHERGAEGDEQGQLRECGL